MKLEAGRDEQGTGQIWKKPTTTKAKKFNFLKQIKNMDKEFY